MSITTKTLATIMLVAMLTLSTVNVGALGSESKNNPLPNDRETRQLDRLYKRHDRKLEIRSSILGMEPEELRQQLKSQPFASVIKRAGFKNEQSFHVALVGKMKDELRARGWDDNKIKRFVDKKLERYSRNHS